MEEGTFYTIVRTVQFVSNLPNDQVLVKDLGSGAMYAVYKQELKTMDESKKRSRQSPSPRRSLSPSLDPPSPRRSLSPSLDPPSSSSRRSSSSSLTSTAPSSPVSSPREIIVEEGDSESSVEKVEPNPAPPPPPRMDFIPTDTALWAYIQIQEPSNRIKTSVRTKNSFSMDTVLFFMSPDIIPKNERSNVTAAIVRLLNFVPNTRITTIFAEMLQDIFLRTAHKTVFDVVPVPEAPTDYQEIPEDQFGDFSSQEQRKNVMYSRGLKQHLKLRQTKVTDTTEQTGSFITKNGDLTITMAEVYVSIFFTNNKNPYRESTIFRNKTLNVIQNRVKLLEFKFKNSNHTLFATTFDGQWDSSWSLTVLTVARFQKQLDLVGLILYHDITRVMPMIEGRFCTNCKQYISGQAYGYEDSHKGIFCGQKCADVHWESTLSLEDKDY